MTRPRLVALAATALALVAAGAVPANAERDRDHDARKDVVALNLDGTGPDYVRVPRNKNTDVTRVVMRHSPNRVIMRTHFRDLHRSTGFAIYQIRTDSGSYDALQLLGSGEGGIVVIEPTVARALGIPRTVTRAVSRAARDKGDAADRFYLFDSDGEVSCDDWWHYAQKRRDRARWSIARSCLGNPTWVRLGAGVISFDMRRGTIVVDDALRDGIKSELGMSGRLHRH